MPAATRETPRRAKRGKRSWISREEQGSFATQVLVTRVEDSPDAETGLLAEITGLLVFARANRSQLRLLEPRSEEIADRGEWPNLLWRFRGTLALSNAGLVLRSLALEPMEYEDPTQDTRPFVGVSPAVLRAIRPDLIIRLAVDRLSVQREEIARVTGQPEGYSPAWLQVWQHRDEQLASAIAAVESEHAERRRKGGRPRLDDQKLRAVAWAAIELYRSKDPPRSIIAVLAERYFASTKTVETWIGEARRRGFLAPGQAGRRTFAPGLNLVPPRPDDEARKPPKKAVKR
jgi:hypothetical protein